MKIRVNNKTINVKSIIGDKIINGTNTYPALRFEFENEVLSDDIQSLTSGNFEILDDNDNVAGTYDGYTTLKSISVVVGKITTAEQRVEELESALAASQSENAELQEALNVVIGGNT